MSNEKGDVTARKPTPGAPPALLRVRGSDILLAIPLSIVVGLFSYVRSVDRSQLSDRREEHAVIRIELREYTTEQVNSVRKNLDDFRELSKEIHRRQDDQIEYNRKIALALRTK